MGVVHGKTSLKMVRNAWEHWKELWKAALVARMQVSALGTTEVWEEMTEWDIIARTNFAQDWAWEANKDKQKEAELPREYQ
jgi:hypothetical protein